MTNFDHSISRDGSNDPLVPVPVSNEIIQAAVADSFILSNARRVTMGAKTNRMPVLSALPMVYHVSGDTGLKQTTSQDWENVELVAEELAAIIPVPEAYISDAQVPIWDEVRPRLAEGIANAVDAACLFGVNAPNTFGLDAYHVAMAAGSTIVKGAGSTKMWQNVAKLGELSAKDGYNINGFAAAPGFSWELIGEADGHARPIFDSLGQALYGIPYKEVMNGGFDTTEALLLGGDWSKAIVGVRQDITFKVFTEGVISDDSGNVVLNLMQQDTVAIRVVFRYAWATANPINRVNPTKASRSPFTVMQATTANS